MDAHHGPRQRKLIETRAIRRVLRETIPYEVLKDRHSTRNYSSERKLLGVANNQRHMFY